MTSKRTTCAPQPRPASPPEAEPEPIAALPATRIALRPHDPHTAEEIGRDEVRKGYEYDRGPFVTFTPGAEGARH
jgi:hypothetical protein